MDLTLIIEACPDGRYGLKSYGVEIVQCWRDWQIYDTDRIRFGTLLVDCGQKLSFVPLKNQCLSLHNILLTSYPMPQLPCEYNSQNSPLTLSHCVIVLSHTSHSCASFFFFFSFFFLSAFFLTAFKDLPDCFTTWVHSPSANFGTVPLSLFEFSDLTSSSSSSLRSSFMTSG